MAVEVLEVHDHCIRLVEYGIRVIEATHIRQCYDIDVQTTWRRFEICKLNIPFLHQAGVFRGRKSGI